MIIKIYSEKGEKRFHLIIQDQKGRISHKIYGSREEAEAQVQLMIPEYKVTVVEV